MDEVSGREDSSLPETSEVRRRVKAPPASRSTLGFVALAAAAAATVGTLAIRGSNDDDRAGAQSGEETSGDDPRTIRVAGHATVDVTPDVATLSLGAQHRAKSASTALDTVSTRTAGMISLLKGAGIAAKDIQTADLSVYPNYGREDKIDGYVASNTVTVRTTDIDGLGQLVDDVAEEAGDTFRLDGISFSFDDPDSVLADVRAEAMANARDKAGQFVADEEVEIGEILSVAEQGADTPMPYELDAREVLAADSAAPIEAGSTELAVDVTVVFELG